MNRPEEAVRQDFIRILIDDYGYRKSEIEKEFPIPRGSRYDRADIAVFKSANKRDPARDLVGIVETKRPDVRTGLAQLKSYMTATSAIWGVWTNGESIEYLCKPKGESAVHRDLLNNVPVRGQRLEDVGKLAKADLKPYSGTALKVSFRRILNTLYANTNISRREKLGNEMIKLIFAKIRDEVTFPDNPPLFYAGYGEEPRLVKKRIDTLFNGVVDEYTDDGLFESHERITLDAKGVAWVVGQLERGSLVDTPTDVVGDAFEVFAESKLVGEKGEFFTPRGVIDIAVRLVNPKPNETVCDPACGSGGFLIATMRTMWAAMEKRGQWRNLREDRLQAAKQQMASRCFYGIDKESDLVRIAKAYMAISGDGRSNVVQQNSLHAASEFDGEAQSRFVRDGSLREFDAVLTNPPYGTKTKVLKEDAALFDLGHQWRKVGKTWKRGKPTERNPYVLFVERCFDMMKAGGRLAIVLPETAFHAPSMEYLRAWIVRYGRVLAVIDLPHNTFRPHCNAKTCLLVVEKGASGKKSDRVIMAEAQEMGHDHQGKAMYRPGTVEVWNDLPVIFNELDNPEDQNNDLTFAVTWGNIQNAGHWIPRYYAAGRKNRKAPKGRRWVLLGDLVDDDEVRAWDGHGSPSSAEKGEGHIPYIRASDIVNWEMYRNPTSGVTQETYDRLTQNRPAVQAEDIIFVRRGSYRIGTVAMASPRDRQVLMMRELLTLRVQRKNKYGITPHYLMALLSSRDVQVQLPRLTFIDTTLPNIGDRWRELRLPIHKDEAEIARMSATVKRAVDRKWQAQTSIDELRREIGGIVT